MKNKLLLEEALFEDDTVVDAPVDAPVDDTEEDSYDDPIGTDTIDGNEVDTSEEPPMEQPEEGPVEDTEDEPQVDDAPVDEPVDDEPPSSSAAEIAAMPAPEPTTYKVTFTLGKHTNWSRVDAFDMEDAKRQVSEYVTKKWPDRSFEVKDIEEFIEEELSESLNEALDVEAQPIETGAAVGMASVIGDMIKDEYEAIDGYISAIATAEAEGFTEAVSILTDIQAEENRHIGQLQTLMKMFDPNSVQIEEGQLEGEEQLSGDSQPMSESVITDLDKLSDREYATFKRVAHKFHNMTPMELLDNYYNGVLKPKYVDDVNEIPGYARTIDISSSDLSQGTGNVVSYVLLSPVDGQLYGYVSY